MSQIESLARAQLIQAVPYPNQPAPAAPAGANAPLPEPALGLFSQVTSGDLGAELAALGVLAGQKQREAAQQARDAFEGVEAQQEDAQVAAMRQKADDAQAEALVSGLFTIGQGAMEMAQGLCSYEAASAKVDDRTMAGFADPAKEVAASKWQLVSNIEKGLATCSKGTSDLVSAVLGAAQGNDDVRATQSRAAADHAKTAADDMRADAREADNFIRAAVDFYREYSATQNQSLLAALRRS